MGTDRPAIAFPHRRWQLAVALLAYLEQARRPKTKREVILFLRHRKMFNLTPEDEEYAGTGNEPRWENQLAWARQDAVERGHMMTPKRRDAWEISEKGVEFIRRVRGKFSSGERDINQCDFWSDIFKTWFLAGSTI